MKVINKIKDKLKKIEICKRHFGDNVMKKNINLVIAFVSVLLIMLWMVIFINSPESFVTNIPFMGINTFLIVYLIETYKVKDNVNMERIILISSILFCSICCLMKYINNLTLAFIILSLLIVYLIYFLKKMFILLNVNFWFLLLMFIITMILGLMTKNMLLLIFKSATCNSIYKNFINDKKPEKNNKEGKKIIKHIINSDIFVQLVFNISVDFVVYKSGNLLDNELVRDFSNYLFSGESMLEILFARGVIALIIVAILSIMTIVAQNMMDS